MHNGTPDGTLVALVECHMKETPGCALTPAIGRLLEICQNNEVESRVSFRDQIETEVVMSSENEVGVTQKLSLILRSSQSAENHTIFLSFFRT